MRIDLAPNERIALVKGMFARIAKRYDTLNHVFSLGRDVFWRRAAARRVRTFRTGRLLDLAAGTGDLTLTLSRMHPEARVIGLDFTWAMLNQARIKSALRAGTQGVRLVGGDALALPFPDRSLDAVTMGFGIRNIPDQPAAFREMLRVLVPNGRAVILELTPPLPSLIGRLYDTYLGRLIPGLGGLISGQALAYQYLADSIMDFPSPEDLTAMMGRAGFDRTGFLKMTFGIATLHWGMRPDAESGPA